MTSQTGGFPMLVIAVSQKNDGHFDHHDTYKLKYIKSPSNINVTDKFHILKTNATPEDIQLAKTMIALMQSTPVNNVNVSDTGETS